MKGRCRCVCVCVRVCGFFFSFLICFPFFLHLIHFRPYLIRVTNTCSYRHQSQMQTYLKTYTTYSTNCSLLVFILLRGAQVMHTNCKILHGTLTTWTHVIICIGNPPSALFQSWETLPVHKWWTYFDCMKSFNKKCCFFWRNNRT